MDIPALEPETDASDEPAYMATSPASEAEEKSTGDEAGSAQMS